MLTKLNSLKNKLTPPMIFGILFTAGCLPFVVYACLRMTFADEYSELSTFFKLSLLYTPPAGVLFYIVGWSIGRFYYSDRTMSAQKLLPALLLITSAIATSVSVFVVYLWIVTASSTAPELREYWNSKFIKKNALVLSSIAGNTNIDSLLLIDIVAHNQSEAVLRAAAKNPKLPIDGFLQLVENPNPKILADLAKNPSLPLPIARTLSEKKDWIILKNLSQNHAAVPEILEKLVNSDDEQVRMNIATNANSAAILLEKLSKDPSENVRRAIAANRNTPVSTLITMSSDQSGEVRYYLTKNPQTPSEVLEKFIDDPDERAKNSARNILGRH